MFPLYVWAMGRLVITIPPCIMFHRLFFSLYFYYDERCYESFFYGRDWIEYQRIQLIGMYRNVKVYWFVLWNEWEGLHAVYNWLHIFIGTGPNYWCGAAIGSPTTPFYTPSTLLFILSTFLTKLILNSFYKLKHDRY